MALVFDGGLLMWGWADGVANNETLWLQNLHGRTFASCCVAQKTLFTALTLDTNDIKKKFFAKQNENKFCYSATEFVTSVHFTHSFP